MKGSPVQQAPPNQDHTQAKQFLSSNFAPQVLRRSRITKRVEYLDTVLLNAGVIAVGFGIFYYFVSASLPALLELYAGLIILLGISGWLMLKDNPEDKLDQRQLQQEINQRKQSETLRQQEQLLRSIFEGVNFNIFVVDVTNNEFHYAMLNSIAEQQLGMRAEQYLGKQPADLFPAPIAAAIDQKFTDCCDRGIPIIAEDRMSFQGVEKWHLSTLVPLHNDVGEVYRLIGTTIDITDRKQAEEVLRQKAQQEQLLNQLANQIRSSLDLDQILETAVSSIRDLLQIDGCNFVWYRPHATPPTWEATHEAKAAELPSVLGLYPSEMIGSAAQRLLNLEILRHDNVRTVIDPLWRQLLLNLGCKSTISIPILTSTSDIGVINCTHHYTLRPWKDSEVELLQSVANQIAIALNQADLYKESRLAAAAAQAQTQQLEQALQELQQTQAQLVQTEKMSSLGQLVAGVAHEINNPVNFIHGNLSHARDYTESLLRLMSLYQQHYPTPNAEIEAEIEAIDLDFLLKDLPKLLSSMKVGTDRIREIVLALRNFSRMDEAEMKTVDIHAGIDSTLMILQNRLKDSPHIGIEVIKVYGEVPLVECYAGQLNQVFMNILANAIDALNDHNAQRTADAINQAPSQITIQTEATDQRVRILIQDNGPGMTEQTRQRLFEPFFTTKPVGKGTGLGLSISYQVIVDRHGGKLSCVSAPGEGAAFLIELPLGQNDNSLN